MHPDEVDPHAFLAQLRQEGPVHRIRLGSGGYAWLVTRYEEARQALNDQRLAMGPELKFRVGRPLPADAYQATSKHMLNADPPDHTRLRRLVSKAFTVRRMEDMRPHIQRIADQLIDSFDSSGEVDLIEDYAFPLPLRVICDLIGVPAMDREAFRDWSNVMIANYAQHTPESTEAIFLLASYVRELVARKRADPDDALLSALIEATDAGDRLDEDELTSTVFLLLIAGHETTVNLIGNAMYLLLKHPDKAAWLRQNPGAVPAAIEEVLRYESPVMNTPFRVTTEPVRCGDVTIPAGELVLVSLLSANRDGVVFDSPNDIDLSRRESQHLAFGFGIHYCLGAPLARVEAQIAVLALLRRFPGVGARGPLSQAEWRRGLLMRGLHRLPVQLMLRSPGQ